MVHAALVRSVHAHATLDRVDVAPARALPGVLACFTGQDLASDLAPIPIRLGADPKLTPFLQRPLAVGCVRYVGEPVAVVVAEDPAIAEDARQAVSVTYGPLPVVADVDAARAPGAGRLFDEGNVAAEWTIDVGDVEAALRNADHVVEACFDLGRQTGMPLEPRGLLARWDAAAGVIEVWGPTKVPYFNRRALAAMLGLSEEQVHFLGADVGGGFGVRGEFYPEDFLIPFLARALGRPVRWIESRREHFTAINHSRQQRCRARLGLRGDGSIAALDVVVEADMGAYLRTHGVWVPALTGAYLPGPYRIDHYRCQVSCVMTNKTPTGTVRGPGVFEGTFVRERLLDMAAGRLGLDPAEIRRRNLLGPDELPRALQPGKLAREIVLEDEDFRAVFDAALAAADYPRLCRERDAANARDPAGRRGIGVAAFVEPSGPGPFEAARVTLEPDGRISVDSGATSVGQGLETTLAQVCAQALGVRVDDVSVRPLDTSRLPTGVGTYASRSAIMAGSAVYGAGRALRQRILEAAAERLEATAGDLRLQDGWVSVVGLPSRGCSLAEIAAWQAAGGRPPLSAEHRHEAGRGLTTFAVHVAVVAVELETGTVRPLRHVVCCDVGRAINPAIVEGQLQGGVVFGLGHALGEELLYDGDGQLVSGTLMDYAVPVAADCPEILVVALEHNPTRSNPLGVKGVGETGTSGVGAAIANAVADALGGRNDITRLPLTAAQIRQAIAAGGAGA